MLKTKCSMCSYDEHKGSLQVHHIDGNHYNNESNNLQILCANCHMKHHQLNPHSKKKKKIISKSYKLTLTQRALKPHILKRVSSYLIYESMRSNFKFKDLPQYSAVCRINGVVIQ